MSSAVVPRRVLLATRATRARSWAIFVFCLGALLSVLAEVISEDSSPDGILDGVGRVAMFAGLVVFVVAQLVRLGTAVLDTAQGHDQPALPTVGRWARVVCQVCCMTLVVLWLLTFVFSMAGDFWSTPGDGGGPVTAALGYVAAAVFAACLGVGLVSVILWLGTEAVVGFREPQRAVVRR